MKTFLTSLFVGLLFVNTPGMVDASVNGGALDGLNLAGFLGDFVVKFSNWGF